MLRGREGDTFWNIMHVTLIHDLKIQQGCQTLAELLHNGCLYTHL